mmetsp:Transcript_17090/g.21046  ORF Transcript_17090/g.21046 Transcript_17090/m.21046 type:complete len:112 (+) Transcript_17090:190-525(+)|eukprot:CAMPEP_0204836066 /NCGR_PEP_ID=MMETSP1346-20131115/24232_1 /ASSEMBLY_ACC=CAM_ASM_000771 /TAXON_ID=215587 /ORGANISM="Aplanochytrium stocchinoi, Strain GSBS06" /LENGTH=111 /DNA_ID=CAMNT_0051970531 /DNA_START=118 /DNA_END=453 /DNA_ORIENTATION=+
MPTDAKLDICVDVLNEAMQVQDPQCAKQIIDKLEVFGYKNDAEALKKILEPGLKSNKTHHVSKQERKDNKKVDKIMRHSSHGQIIVHPEDGGSPRSYERLPSIEMLLNRNS